MVVFVSFASSTGVASFVRTSTNASSSLFASSISFSISSSSNATFVKAIPFASTSSIRTPLTTSSSSSSSFPNVVFVAGLDAHAPMWTTVGRKRGPSFLRRRLRLLLPFKSAKGKARQSEDRYEMTVKELKKGTSSSHTKPHTLFRFMISRTV